MSGMDADTLDVIAVGAHPDDVEIACGGTLARLAKQGYRVGIVDLTDGEPTPLSPGPEVRLAEAQRAADTLGVATRIQLGLTNRRLFDGFEARVALAKEFRRYRPKLVLGFGETAKGSKAEPNGRSVLRIGSVSKAFAGELLASLAADGQTSAIPRRNSCPA